MAVAEALEAIWNAALEAISDAEEERAKQALLDSTTSLSSSLSTMSSAEFYRVLRRCGVNDDEVQDGNWGAHEETPWALDTPSTSVESLDLDQFENNNAGGGDEERVERGGDADDDADGEEEEEEEDKMEGGEPPKKKFKKLE